MIRFTEAPPDELAAQTAGLSLNTRSVLQGDIVTMNEQHDVVRDGRLCLEGNRIAAVLRPGAPLPPGFEGATVVDTSGTLFPGLMDLHNHLTYNMIPLWPVPARYTNRSQWREKEPSYRTLIATPASVLSKNADADYRRAIVRFAECRNLLGGVTTGQGMSSSSSEGYRKYFEGLLRNVEHPLDVDWPAASGQTLDYLPEEIGTKLKASLAKGTPFFYHLSEGNDAEARQRFLDLQTADRSWMVNRHLICIHCVALRGNDFEVLMNAAGMVWSPTSNLLLYGETAAVEDAKAHGVPIALGADWAPSGCKNLLGELKIAQLVSQAKGNLFSAPDLVDMVTATPARMLGWDRWVGSLAVDRRADILVIAGQHADPYQALIDSREDAIRAVLIEGRIRLGEAQGLTLGAPDSSELLMIGNKPYFLDLTESQNDGLGGMTLATAVAKLSYGLEHLPELLNALPMQVNALKDRAQPDVWELDMDPALDVNIVELACNDALRGAVRPMKLEPLTAVDDPGFKARLKTNSNLPDYVRARL